MYRDGSQALSTSDLTIATMANVAVGSYAITAKTVGNLIADDANDTLTCTLVVAGSILDTAEFSRNDHENTLLMTGTATLASTASIALRCRATGTASVRFSRIVTVKVDTIQRDAVSG